MVDLASDRGGGVLWTSVLYHGISMFWVMTEMVKERDSKLNCRKADCREHPD
jgi:hypothetical protein